MPRAQSCQQGRTWTRFVLGMRESLCRNLPKRNVIRIPSPEQKGKIEARIECWLSEPFKTFSCLSTSGLAKKCGRALWSELLQRPPRSSGVIDTGWKRVLSKRIQEAGRRSWARLINWMSEAGGD